MLSGSKHSPTYHCLIHTGWGRILRHVWCAVIPNVHTPKASLMRELETIDDRHSSCVAMRMSAREFIFKKLMIFSLKFNLQSLQLARCTRESEECRRDTILSCRSARGPQHHSGSAREIHSALLCWRQWDLFQWDKEFNKINKNNFKPPVSEEVKNIVRQNFSREIEFYKFCKQRLQTQFLAANLMDLK
jgi:hypothetical protein